MRPRFEDPTLLTLLVIAGIALVVALRRGPVLLKRVGDAVVPWLPWLVVAVAIAAIAVAVVAVVRFVVTRRTLSSRVSLCVLPTETFEPSDQSVRFFSRQLPGVPRLVRGWMDPRAGAVRVRMAAAGQGRMMYSWEAPARSRSALQAAAGAYDEIEVRPAETFVATPGAVASAGVDAGGDDDPPATSRPVLPERGDGTDELNVDEAEALGELVELSPFWAGDPGLEEHA